MGLRVYDPYQVDGSFYKVQLHTHTRRSIDGKWSIGELRDCYKKLGFSFVFITDHDRVVRKNELDELKRSDPAGCPILIGGEESTIAAPVWPLGRHMLRLFIMERCIKCSLPERIKHTLVEGGMVCICHPTWKGNFGLGTWPLDMLVETPAFELIEIYNYHSDSDRDVEIWDMLLKGRSRANPLWGTAVDDAHHWGRAGFGWIEAKLAEFSVAALREALHSGSFYATTGISASFVFDQTRSELTASGYIPGEGSGCDISYRVMTGAGIAGEGKAAAGETIKYPVRGEEGYVRFELAESSTGRGAACKVRKAWSQPFWIES